MPINRRAVIVSAPSVGFLSAKFTPALAQDLGVSDTEIKFGQATAYCGPLSGAGLIKKTQVTFFDRLGAATHLVRSEAHTKMEALLSYPKISDRRECSR
jgi:hypothetical protein